MSFDVTWDAEARDEVRQIFDEALDKEAVVHAVMRINLELAAVPLEAGESREADTRILFKFPLVVWFQVEQRMRQVSVLHVRSMT